jgi:dTDP-4-dehydrorhamnose reductase
MLSRRPERRFRAEPAMRVLVAGSQGQLARSLIEAAGHRPEVRLVALGRPSLDILAAHSASRSIDEVSADIVVNAAAYTAVDRAESEPDLAFAINRDGARALAAAAAARGLPIVHLSTDYVFDGDKDEPYAETDATAPINVYGRSKLEGEAAVTAANPKHVILRTSWVHSPFGSNFVKTVVRLARERGELRIVADQHGAPTYAPHLAEAILDVVLRLGGRHREDAPWGLYHLAGAGETTWHGLAQQVVAEGAGHGMREVAVRPISTADYPTPAQRPANSRLSCGKIERAFGIALPPWPTGVRACVERLYSGST